MTGALGRCKRKAAIAQTSQKVYTAIMLFSLYSVTIIVSAFAFSWIGCSVLRLVLASTNVMDEPNERSNHKQPIPRGGGIAVIISIISFLYVAATPTTLLVATLGIAIASFMDDKGGIAIRWRLLVQILAVTLLFIPNGVVDTHFDGLIFQGIFNPFSDKLFAGILLLGFMNLFNFMDGIDGITGAQTIAIGGGLCVLSMMTSGIRIIGLEGIVIAAAAAGFLMLNWHPAKLFLGDVGSVALGYLIGFLLLALAAKGHWAAAAILPAYYLIDGGLTFLKRLITAQKVWEAHSQHAYQKAVRGGYTHDWVVIRISLLNILLIALAAATMLYPQDTLILIGAAYVMAFGLWLLLLSAKKPATQTVIPPQATQRSDALSA